MDARYSPQVGVLLMIAPDHLNWHPDMGDYVAAKQNLFAHQEAGSRAIYNACNIYSLRAGLGAPGDQMAYNAVDGAWVDGDQVKIGDTTICTSADIALPGRHNWDNVCAAITATWPIVGDAATIKRAIRAFKGLEHRLETVATVAGVTYVNDSYSATTGSTLAALAAFTQPKVLILGGYDKQLDYADVAQAVTQTRVRQVVVIGAASPKISAALDKVGFHDYVLGPADMTEIVAAAAQVAQSGDVVLLSPGTSSFDMFKDFKQRGEHFKQAVAALARAAK
jgi:UDP-N-acetylmuramoylalanine--D-glutamate ligase